MKLIGCRSSARCATARYKKIVTAAMVTRRSWPATQLQPTRAGRWRALGGGQMESIESLLLGSVGCRDILKRQSQNAARFAPPQRPTPGLFHSIHSIPVHSVQTWSIPPSDPFLSIPFVPSIHSSQLHVLHPPFHSRLHHRNPPLSAHRAEHRTMDDELILPACPGNRHPPPRCTGWPKFYRHLFSTSSSTSYSGASTSGCCGARRPGASWSYWAIWPTLW